MGDLLSDDGRICLRFSLSLFGQQSLAGRLALLLMKDSDDGTHGRITHSASAGVSRFSSNVF